MFPPARTLLSRAGACECVFVGRCVAALAGDDIAVPVVTRAKLAATIRARTIARHRPARRAVARASNATFPPAAFLPSGDATRIRETSARRKTGGSVSWPARRSVVYGVYSHRGGPAHGIKPSEQRSMRCSPRRQSSPRFSVADSLGTTHLEASSGRLSTHRHSRGHVVLGRVSYGRVSSGCVPYGSASQGNLFPGNVFPAGSFAPAGACASTSA